MYMKTPSGRNSGVKTIQMKGADIVRVLRLDKMTVYVIFMIAVFLPIPLHAFDLGGIFSGKKDEKVVPLQEQYESLPVTVPAVAMFAASATTAIPDEMLRGFEQELYRQMIQKKIVKPVSMNTWLYLQYGKRKVKDPLVLLERIGRENYVVPLQMVCKPYLFRTNEFYGVRLSLYGISGDYYPVDVFRLFSDPIEIPAVIGACLDEVSIRVRTPDSGLKRKKILVEKFSLEIKKLVELESGEFEYIEAPFIQQGEVTLRSEDELFSQVCAYVFTSTGFYHSVVAEDFSLFSDTSFSDSANADYIIRGRVQLSDQMSVLYFYLLDASNGKELLSVRYPLRDFSLQTVWNAYREISCTVSKKILPEGSFGIATGLESDGSMFYVDNYFVGWDSMEGFLVPRGILPILTGSFLYSWQRLDAIPESMRMIKLKQNKSIVQIFYAFYDTGFRLFTDRDGEYLQNLLSK